MTSENAQTLLHGRYKKDTVAISAVISEINFREVYRGDANTGRKIPETENRNKLIPNVQ